MPARKVWVIPFPEISPFMKKYAAGRMNTVFWALILRTGSRYENAWKLIE